MRALLAGTNHDSSNEATLAVRTFLLGKTVISLAEMRYTVRSVNS